MQFLIAGVIGLVSGITSGLFGVGGGIVMVPAMMFFMRDQIGDNIKVAIGTSLAVIIPTALIGSFKHYQQGNINWQVVLALVPAVFAVVKANPAMFWPVILVATLGNTLGGVVDYWIGYRAKVAFAKERKSRWFHWLARYGSKTMLLSWVPGIGDPLCTLAG